MQQPITHFSQDAANDWIAHLRCGHKQHVRHDPPLRDRPWVQHAAGRQAFIGTAIPCKQCTQSQEQSA